MVVQLASGSTVDDLRHELDGLGGDSRFGIDPAEIVPRVVQDAASTRGTGIAVLALIVGLATVVVLGQVLARQVRRSDQQELVLQALGMSRPQRVAEQVGQAAVPVLVGALLAGVVAAAVSGWFPLGFVEQIEPDPGLRVDPLVHLLGPVVVAAAVLAWVTVSVVATRRRARVSTTQGPLDRVVTKIRHASIATGVRFAFQRFPGEPGTGRIALTGLVVVLAGLVAAATFGASLGRLVDEPERYGAYDLVIGQGGDLPPDLGDALAQDDDVAGYGLGGTALTSVGADSLDVSAIQTLKGDVDPYVFRGRLPVEDDEVALGKVSARHFGVDVDDDLVIGGADEAQTLHVTGIVLMPSIEGGEGIGTGALVTVDRLGLIDPDASLSAGLVDLAPGSSPGAVMSRIADQFGLGGAFVPEDEIGGSAPGDIINLDRIRAIPFVVAGAFAALAVLTLSHQLIVSGRRRRRDLAVLRALGADARWVTAVVHTQATAVALVALVVALPAGLLVGRVVFRAFVERIGALEGVAYGSAFLVASALLVLVLANLIALGTDRAARRRTTARLLAAE